MNPTWRMALAFISALILLPYIHAFIVELVCQVKDRFQ